MPWQPAGAQGNGQVGCSGDGDRVGDEAAFWSQPPSSDIGAVDVDSSTAALGASMAGMTHAKPLSTHTRWVSMSTTKAAVARRSIAMSGL